MKNNYFQVETHHRMQSHFEPRVSIATNKKNEFPCGTLSLTELHFDLNTLAKLRSFLSRNSCTTASKNSELDSVGAIFNRENLNVSTKATKSIQLPVFSWLARTQFDK